jgi:hypothetical protein
MTTAETSSGYPRLANTFPATRKSGCPWWDDSAASGKPPSANQAWAYAMMGKRDQAMKMVGRTKDEFARADFAMPRERRQVFVLGLERPRALEQIAVGRDAGGNHLYPLRTRYLQPIGAVVREVAG